MLSKVGCIHSVAAVIFASFTLQVVAQQNPPDINENEVTVDLNTSEFLDAASLNKISEAEAPAETPLLETKSDLPYQNIINCEKCLPESVIPVFNSGSYYGPVILLISLLANIAFFIYSLSEKKKDKRESAYDEFWLRSIFVNDIEKLLASICDKHKDYWSKAILISSSRISFSRYLELSFQNDLHLLVIQLETISSAFEELPQDVVNDSEDLLDSLDALVVAQCEKIEAEVDSIKKEEHMVIIINELTLLPANILIILMHAHKKFVSNRISS